jgi:hypothetical protein
MHPHADVVEWTPTECDEPRPQPEFRLLSTGGAGTDRARSYRGDEGGGLQAVSRIRQQCWAAAVLTWGALLVLRGLGRCGPFGPYVRSPMCVTANTQLPTSLIHQDRQYSVEPKVLQNPNPSPTSYWIHHRRRNPVRLAVSEFLFSF